VEDVILLLSINLCPTCAGTFATGRVAKPPGGFLCSNTKPREGSGRGPSFRSTRPSVRTSIAGLGQSSSQGSTFDHTAVQWCEKACRPSRARGLSSVPARSASWAQLPEGRGWAALLARQPHGPEENPENQLGSCADVRLRARIGARQGAHHDGMADGQSVRKMVPEEDSNLRGLASEVGCEAYGTRDDTPTRFIT
jgi:hypothetical protein